MVTEKESNSWKPDLPPKTISTRSSVPSRTPSLPVHMLDSKPRDIARALSRDKPISQSTRVFESSKIENRIESEKVEAESDRDDTDHFSSDVNEAMGRIKYLKKRKRLRWEKISKICKKFENTEKYRWRLH